MSDPSPTYREAIFTPVLQALFFGLLGYPFLAGVAFYLAWQRPWLDALIIDGFVSWFAYVAYVEKWYGYLIVLAGPPAPAPAPIRQLFTAQVTWDGGRAGAWAEFGVERGWFAKWCRGVARGVTLAESIWTGGAYKPSVRVYRAMLATMRAEPLLLVEWVNERAHGQGMRLTGKGMAAVAAWNAGEWARNVSRETFQSPPTAADHPVQRAKQP